MKSKRRALLVQRLYGFMMTDPLDRKATRLACLAVGFDKGRPGSPVSFAGRMKNMINETYLILMSFAFMLFGT